MTPEEEEAAIATDEPLGFDLDQPVEHQGVAKARSEIARGEVISAEEIRREFA